MHNFFGKNNHFYGKRHSELALLKMRTAAQVRISNPEWINKIKSSAHIRNSSCEWRRQHSERIKQHYQKPEFQIKRFFQYLERKDRHIKNQLYANTQRRKKSQNRPEVIAKHKAYMNLPGSKDFCRQAAVKQWQTSRCKLIEKFNSPNIKSKKISSCKAYWRSTEGKLHKFKIMNSFEYKIKVSMKSKIMWQNPEHRIKMEKHLANIKGKSTDTKPHLKIKQLLNELNIEFESEKRILNRHRDIYIPKYNLVIEADGDYWHCNPKFFNADFIIKNNKKNAKSIWQKDLRRDQELKENNFKTLRLWESDIKLLTSRELLQKIISI